MNEPLFQIGAEGVNVDKIVGEIQTAADKKMKDGAYADARIARAERTNLANLRNEEQFLTFYLQCLRDAVFVDINDYEIRERRTGLGPVLVALKTAIWKLLKFYTYRLWSQQNQVNGLLVTAIEGLDEKYAEKVKQLEKQIEELKGRR